MTTEGKELTFAVLILLAPHFSLSMAIWCIGGLILVALLCSVTVRYAWGRVWDHLTRQS